MARYTTCCWLRWAKVSDMMTRLDQRDHKSDVISQTLQDTTAKNSFWTENVMFWTYHSDLICSTSYKNLWFAVQNCCISKGTWPLTGWEPANSYCQLISTFSLCFLFWCPLIFLKTVGFVTWVFALLISVIMSAFSQNLNAWFAFSIFSSLRRSLFNLHLCTVLYPNVFTDLNFILWRFWQFNSEVLVICHSTRQHFI